MWGWNFLEFSRIFLYLTLRTSWKLILLFYLCFKWFLMSYQLEYKFESRLHRQVFWLGLLIIRTFHWCFLSSGICVWRLFHMDIFLELLLWGSIKNLYFLGQFKDIGGAPTDAKWNDWGNFPERIEWAQFIFSIKSKTLRRKNFQFESFLKLVGFDRCRKKWAASLRIVFVSAAGGRTSPGSGLKPRAWVWRPGLGFRGSGSGLNARAWVWRPCSGLKARARYWWPGLGIKGPCSDLKAWARYSRPMLGLECLGSDLKARSENWRPTPCESGSFWARFSKPRFISSCRKVNISELPRGKMELTCSAARKSVRR